MGKVKLTEKQVDVLEKMVKQYGEDLTVIRHAEKYFNLNCEKELLELTTAEVAKALYIGYEIEPEFKEGDWVYHDTVHVGIVTEIEGGVITIDKKLGYKRGDGTDAYVNALDKYYRHATPEEIAKEKQRRFWNSNNRDVWELKKDDILINKKDPHTTNVKFVEDVDSDGVILLVGGGDLLIDLNVKERLKGMFKVFCFAEDRKDL